MKSTFLIPALLAATITLLPAQDESAPAASSGPKPADFKSQLSYIIGQDMAESFQRIELDLDKEVYIQGLRDALDGRSSLLSAGEKADVMQELELTRMPPEQAAAAKASLEAGAKFLAENAQREGVEVTDSGLQYEVLQDGDPAGVSPVASSSVLAHYHGTLVDGTVFDSSVDRGEPISFAVTGVIPGWTEALQIMKPGDKYKLFIPSRLAYGLNPRPGGAIKPGDALVFDVELLEVQNPPGAAPGLPPIPGTPEQ